MNAPMFSMTEFSRCLVWLVIWLFLAAFLMPYAAKVGGIWESQSSPTRNVTVELKSGQKLQGDLVISWSHKYLLTTSNGERIEFDDADPSALVFEIPVDQRTRSISDMWRAWVPVYLSGVFCLLVGFFPLARYFFGARKESKGSVC